MKKQYAVLAAVMAMVLVQPAGIYGANSPGSKPVISGGGTPPTSSMSGDYKPMTPQDSIVLGGGTGAAGGGSTVIGNAAVGFAGQEKVKEMFTEKTVEAINTINAGTTPLYRVIGTPEMVGYSALAPVQVLTAVDTVTGNAVNELISMKIYVPNLIEGLGVVKILYYDQATGTWLLADPAAIDYAAKEVTVSVANGAVFTVVYKK